MSEEIWDPREIRAVKALREMWDHRGLRDQRVRPARQARKAILGRRESEVFRDQPALQVRLVPWDHRV